MEWLAIIGMILFVALIGYIIYSDKDNQTHKHILNKQ